MSTRSTRIALAFAAAAAVTAGPRAQSAPSTSGYQLPPKVIVDILDAAPTPTVIVAPNRQMVALLERQQHAGHRRPGRADPPDRRRADQPADQRAAAAHGRRDRRSRSRPSPTERRRRSSCRRTPTSADLAFSPDGKQLAFTNTKANGIELWVADTATGQSRLVSGADRLNATAGEPCDWLEDSATLVCTTVPAGRGPAPAEPRVPAGPNVQENLGKASPAPTLEDMLKTKYDEDLFEYYFTSQVVTYDAAAARKTADRQARHRRKRRAVAERRVPARLEGEAPLLAPLSDERLPEGRGSVEPPGELARKVADVPTAEGIPINGVLTGPRQYRWRPDQPATLVWVEALDQGNPKNAVPYRDRLLTLSAPFTGQPAEFGKTEWRFASLSFTDKGIGAPRRAVTARRGASGRGSSTI